MANCSLGTVVCIANILEKKTVPFRRYRALNWLELEIMSFDGHEYSARDVQNFAVDFEIFLMLPYIAIKASLRGFGLARAL